MWCHAKPCAVGRQGFALLNKNYLGKEMVGSLEVIEIYKNVSYNLGKNLETMASFIDKFF